MKSGSTVKAKEHDLEVAQRWRSVAENLPDGLVVHDEGGKITLANSAAIRLLGVRSAAELEGRSLLDFLDEPSRILAKTRWNKLARGQGVQMSEMRVLRGSEDKVHIEVYMHHVPETGEIQAVFHDVTRRKNLLSEMRHRVGRSYNQVIGFLLLQEQFTEDQKVLRAIATLRERIQAAKLVHSILSRTGEESHVEMKLYFQDLGEALVREHGAGGEVALGFSVSKVLLNERQATACGLIVSELVWNALRHAFPTGALEGRKGRISVSLRPREDILRLEVADNGIGMRRSSRKAGESMGLSLVRSLVRDDLNGTIKKTSARPGTRFTIEFRRKITR